MVSHLYLRGPIFSELKASRFSSSIVDKLPEATQSLGIAYFFFDGRDSQKELQLHNKLIRSLILQLSDTQHGGITENLEDLYKRCGEIRQPSDEQLHNVLRDILDRFSQAYWSNVQAGMKYISNLQSSRRVLTKSITEY